MIPYIFNIEETKSTDTVIIPGKNGATITNLSINVSKPSGDYTFSLQLTQGLGDSSVTSTLYTQVLSDGDYMIDDTPYIINQNTKLTISGDTGLSITIIGKIND